jgi:hypothetical protein
MTIDLPHVYMRKARPYFVHFTIKSMILGLKPKLQCLIDKMSCFFSHIGYKMTKNKKNDGTLAHKISLQSSTCYRKVSSYRTSYRLGKA